MKPRCDLPRGFTLIVPGEHTMAEAKPPPLPTQLRIAHATFTVKVDNKACAAQEANGTTVIDEREITVRDDLPVDKLREVLLHETLHGCFNAGALALPNAQEERLVGAITGPLLQTLRDNPDLVAFLLAP